MTPTEFPRILVVTSNNFNLMTGGGITLTNLFRGWPADRIANLHEDPTPEDTSVCRNFYRLSKKEEVRWAWPFSLAEDFLDGKRHRRGDEQGIGWSVERQAEARGGVKRIAVSRALFRDGVPRTVRISDRLDAWLENFEPHLLYGFLGSMAQIRLARELSRRYRLPVAIHMMDDWPSVLYRGGLVGPLLRTIALKEFRAVMKQASLRMGICVEMCDEYQRRYGVPFLPFHNALDMEQWISHARQDWKAGSPFIVRYVGSIVADAQKHALRDVCQAVARLRVSGRAIEMWVHAPEAQAVYLKGLGGVGQGLRLVGPPGDSGIVRLLSEADLLVLPFNFDKRSLEYIRLSMPTKVPAYMASGTPVLVYGPAGIATARYAGRDGWGHVLSTPGVAALEKTLLWLIDDQAARERLGRRAHLLACQRHDAAHIRPDFWALLSAAAQCQHLSQRTAGAWEQP